LTAARTLAVRPPDPPADLATLDVAGLRRELVASLSLTAAHLTRLAWIVRLLEERGEDLSDLRIGLLDYLRRIAHGQVLAELVARHAASPALLRTLAALPLPEQARIAGGGQVTLVVRGTDGKFDRRLADVARMTRGQVAQVFGPSGLRDEPEQILLLEGRPPSRETGATSPPGRGKVEVDRVRGGLLVGKLFVPAGEVVLALAGLKGDPDGSPADVGVSVKLTEAEHVALKNASTRSGASMNVLVRRALAAFGLFTGE